MIAWREADSECRLQQDFAGLIADVTGIGAVERESQEQSVSLVAMMFVLFRLPSVFS